MTSFNSWNYLQRLEIQKKACKKSFFLTHNLKFGEKEIEKQNRELKRAFSEKMYYFSITSTHRHSYLSKVYFSCLLHSVEITGSIYCVANLFDCDLSIIIRVIELLFCV